MANEIAKAYVQIIPSAEGMGTSLTSIVGGAATTAGLSGGTTLGSGILSNMKGILTGTAITAAVAGVVKALKACVDEASEFDASMSQVAATMGTSVDEIAELSDFAKEMGRTTAFSANEAAEGLNTLALAGLDADEQMAVLPEVMNLASAGCLDLDDAASYVTGSIKGFNDSMENAQYYTDLMAKGATLANTDVNDLGEALSSSAATATSYGQEADSVTLSLLRLAEQNVTGSDAATALNRAMADLYTPTDAAKQALDELGVSVYDSEGNARDFNDVVDELSGALSGMSAEEQNTYKDTIFTTRGLQAFNKMTVSSSDTVNEFKEALADCSGSAMQQAETQLDNLQGDVTLFKSAMSGLKISIGEALTPMLRSVTQFATNFVTGLTDIITGTRTVKEVFSDAMTNIGQKIFGEDWEGMGTFLHDHLLEPIKNLPSNVMEHITNFCSNIREKIQNIDWHQVGYNLTTKLLNGVKAITVEGPRHIVQFCQNIKTKIQETDWKQVGQNLITKIGNGLKNFTESLGKVKEFCSNIKTVFQETDWKELGKNIISGIGNGIKNFASNAFEKVKEAGSGILDAFKDFFQTGSPSRVMEEQGGYLVDGLELGMDGMSEAANGALSETLNTIDDFGQTANKAMENASSGVVSTVDSSYGQVPSHVDKPLANALSNVKNWGSNVMSNIKSSTSGTVTSLDSNFAQVPNKINSSLKSTTSNITSWGSQTQSSGSNIGRNFVTAISGGMQNLSNKVSSLLTSTTNTVTKWGTALGSSATSIANTFASNFQSGLSNLNSKVSSILSSVQSTISGYESKMTNEGTTLGQNLVQGMINGLNNKSSSLYSTISSIVNSAISKANSAAATGSPSKKMMWTGQMMDEGLALGLSEYAYKVDNAMDDVMSVMDAANGTNYNATVGTAYGSAKAGNVINITQNIYSQAQTAAQLMREARHQAQRAVMQGV